MEHTLSPLLSLHQCLCPPVNIHGYKKIEGRLHDPVTWYRINYTGTQVPLRNLRPSHVTGSCKGPIIGGVTYTYQNPCELITAMNKNPQVSITVNYHGQDLAFFPFELFLLLDLGMLSAWDTRQNKCFIHWEGDSSEIGK